MAGVSGMASDRLPEELRATAQTMDQIHPHAQHLMRMAADALEGLEQALLDIAGWENWQTPTWREIARNALPEHAESECLEHKAVMPENTPNIPMREFYAEGFGGYADYRDDMVRWVRAVTEIDRSKP